MTMPLNAVSLYAFNERMIHSSARHVQFKLGLRCVILYMAGFIFFQPVQAQTDSTAVTRFFSDQSLSCTGSLGDPVVKITFGAGQNFGPALAPGITNMQYVSSLCPNDGEYTIVNSSGGCFGDSWHTIRDHTGDVNGYFMLINASYQPSDFYLQTVNGLCSGTTYRFSAYIMNVLRLQAFLPNITFSIEKADGTVLQSYNTGDLPNTSQPVYTEFGFFFTTPPGVQTVVLRMRNNSLGGIGNDLAIDDISFSPAGPQTSISVTGLTADTISFCKRSAQFQSSVENCFSLPEYQWQVSNNGGINWTDIPGATATNYTTPVLLPGSYLYRMTVAQAGNIGQSNCRVNSNNFLVRSLGSNPVLFDTTITRCPGGSFTLPWGPVVYATGTYSDTAQSINGCDSLVRRYRFRIQERSFQNLQETVCSGDFYQLPSGIRVYLPGNYVDTARTLLEQCDSIITNLRLDTLPRPGLSVSKSNDIGCRLGTAKLSVRGGLSYLWKPASSVNGQNLSDPIVSPANTTTYTVQGTSTNGCVSEDSIIVYVDRRAAGEIFALPTAFTPNGDGINDCFGAGFMGYTTEFSMIILDRWGNQLFKTSDPALCWDGKQAGADMPTGTYVYYVRARTICGPVLKRGTVLLLR